MQRKKKRSIIFELHSIPIKLRSLCTKLKSNTYSIPQNKSISLSNSKRLYLVSYSIPLSCMVVLLLGSIVMVNPSLPLKSSAIEVEESETVEIEGDTDNIIDNSLDESFGGFAEDDPNDAVVDSDDTTSYTNADSGDDSIMPLASTASITFSIGGAGVSDTVETSVDEVAYRSHTVKVSIGNADDYYLMISGQPTMTSGGTTMTGISGSVTGANIPAGQWGYGWDYTGSKTDAAMTYTAIPSADAKLTVPNLSSNAVSFTGKLNFAAKFPSNATLGKYSSTAKLTLVVTPKAQTGTYWRDATGATTALNAGITRMQDIKSGFCKNNSSVGEGWTIDLLDNRGTNPVTYTVVKLNGNCWMGQNLALTGPLTLTSADSDVSSNWTLPASVGSGGTNSNNVNTSNTWDTDNNSIQVKTGNTSLSGWKQGYGSYYSWPAATAGTGTTSIRGTNAPSSICPISWKLPPNSGDGSYANLANAYKSPSTLGGQTINGVSGMTGRYFGLDSTSVYKGANFWPAAGNIASTDATSIINSGGVGAYWSRTGSSDLNYAYFLYFSSSTFLPSYSSEYGRWRGLSIRCVADY